MVKLAGSFRDPSGHVFLHEDDIVRGVTDYGLADYQAVKNSKALASGLAQTLVVASEEIPCPFPIKADGQTWLGQDYAIWLKHMKIPFISYPYEWSFSQLKAITLSYLDLAIDLFDKGVVLSDATPFNQQFDGESIVFIDYLSFRPYRSGEAWQAYRQFCEQFLAPLVMQSHLGMPITPLSKGQLMNYSLPMLSALLPASTWLSPALLFHIHLHAKAIKKFAMANQQPHVKIRQAAEVKIPAQQYRAILTSLRRYIEHLKPKGDSAHQIWRNYEKTLSYQDSERQAKRQFVSRAVERVKPKLLVDLGCNAGEYSIVALESGASYVVGSDIDHDAIEIAYERVRLNKLRFLPLVMDLMNPSPSMGWQEQERESFLTRVSSKADMILALALTHHLAISHNVPLPEVVASLVALAPCGVIEFIPYSDPMIQQMIASRPHMIFPHYDQPSFEASLVAKASILDRLTVSDTGRTLYFYSKA